MLGRHYNHNSKFYQICDFTDGFPFSQISNLFKQFFKKTR